jgi:hypothetical protein
MSESAGKHNLDRQFMSPSSGLTWQRIKKSTHTSYMRLKCAFNENRCMYLSPSFGCLNPQASRWSSAFTFPQWPGSWVLSECQKTKKNKNWTKKNLNKTKTKTKTKLKQNLETSLSRLKSYMVSCCVQIWWLCKLRHGRLKQGDCSNLYWVPKDVKQLLWRFCNLVVHCCSFLAILGHLHVPSGPNNPTFPSGFSWEFVRDYVEK